MGWHGPSIRGDLGFWTCDSCTTMKDKSCFVLSEMRLSWMRGKLNPEGLPAVFQATESACPHSRHNKPVKRYVGPSSPGPDVRNLPDPSGRVGY